MLCCTSSPRITHAGWKPPLGVQARNMIIRLFSPQLWKNLTTPAPRGYLKDTTITKLLLHHGIIGVPQPSKFLMNRDQNHTLQSLIKNALRMNQSSIECYENYSWKPIGCHIRPKAKYPKSAKDSSNFLIMDDTLHRAWDDNVPSVTFYYAEKSWEAGSYKPVAWSNL